MGGIFGGGGDKTKKVTTTNVPSPYPAARPGYDLFYKNLIDAYKAGGLNQAPYPGQTVAGAAPETAQAWQGIASRAASGSPLNAAAGGYIQRLLDPSYLTSDSPGLSSVIDLSRQGVNSQFSQAGRTFSGAHANALASSEGQLRYQDLLRKAQEQQAAAGMAPNLAAQDYYDLNQLGTVGTQRQAQLQDEINAEIERYNLLQAMQGNELGTFSNLLSGGVPFGSTQTQPVVRDRTNPWLAGLGTIASIGSLFA